MFGSKIWIILKIPLNAINSNLSLSTEANSAKSNCENAVLAALFSTVYPQARSSDKCHRIRSLVIANQIFLKHSWKGDNNWFPSGNLNERSSFISLFFVTEIRSECVSKYRNWIHLWYTTVMTTTYLFSSCLPVSPLLSPSGFTTHIKIINSTSMYFADYRQSQSIQDTEILLRRPREICWMICFTVEVTTSYYLSDSIP